MRMSHKMLALAVFLLDGQRYALRLSAIARIVRAVAVTPLPSAPEIVLGVINVQGLVIPLVNLRRRFHLPERPIELNDQFIIASTATRTLALVVDQVEDIVELPETAITAAEAVVPGLDYVAGVARQPDGLILIHDLDTFLSLDEERSLQNALEG